MEGLKHNERADLSRDAAVDVSGEAGSYEVPDTNETQEVDDAGPTDEELLDLLTFNNDWQPPGVSASSPQTPTFPDQSFARYRYAAERQTSEPPDVQVTHVSREVTSRAAASDTLDLSGSSTNAEGPGLEHQALEEQRQRDQPTIGAADAPSGLPEGQVLEAWEAQIRAEAPEIRSRHDDFLRELPGLRAEDMAAKPQDLSKYQPAQSYGAHDMPFPPHESIGYDAMALHTEDWMIGKPQRKSIEASYEAPNQLEQILNVPRFDQQLQAAPQQAQYSPVQQLQQPQVYSEQPDQVKQNWLQDEYGYQLPPMSDYSQNHAQTHGQFSSPTVGQVTGQSHYLVAQAQSPMQYGSPRLENRQHQGRQLSRNVSLGAQQSSPWPARSQFQQEQDYRRRVQGVVANPSRAQMAWVPGRGQTARQSVSRSHRLQLPAANVLLSQTENVSDSLVGPSPTLSAGEVTLRYNSWQEVNRRKLSTQQALHIPSDPTYPRFDELEQRYVKQMISAMNSMEDAKDNPGMIDMWRRMKRNTDAVEDTAWELLVSIQDVPQHSPGVSLIFPRASVSAPKASPCRWFLGQSCQHSLRALRST